ncbi:peptidylprolyl isomerase [Wenzhouxiangella marina]|uniref:peptidylprolyl isomerase n=1 Tax=Wenzhouxiangella marina TaxID=1579979 RepID=A0A0K0Y051_9GAMM|nr:peptidylprolyl isomerase [Wenzhouxiangella marina]AKS43246.1 peptidylprolyl isomerase [Wenzhouxiangella marina]MBB6087067.1 cyclophilin family peptidyl-prolyl cis-trans isomerase [Wenzhouxiangella marina]
MFRSIARFSVLSLALGALGAQAQDPDPRVYFDTDRGPIIVELDPLNAPVTTQNFLDYVEAGFYDGLVFHRIFNDYIIEGGAFDRDGAPRIPMFDPIPSEADNGLLNVTGTIAMANGGDTDGAQAGFYFNMGDNDVLDGDYTVFGEVIAGQRTLNDIESAGRTIDPDDGSVTSLPFSPTVIRRAVAYLGDFPILPLHSGSWFSPASAGAGFAVEVTQDASNESGPIVVVYWYDFNNGQPMWLTGSNSFEYGATEVEIELIGVPAPEGSVDFQQPPAGEDFTVQGTVTIAFESCSAGTFSYDLTDFGSGEIPVTRLTLPSGSSCQAFQHGQN